MDPQSGQSLAFLTHEKSPKGGVHEISEIEIFFLMPDVLEMHETSRSGVIWKNFFLKKSTFWDLVNF